LKLVAYTSSRMGHTRWCDMELTQTNVIYRGPDGEAWTCHDPVIHEHLVWLRPKERLLPEPLEIILHTARYERYFKKSTISNEILMMCLFKYEDNDLYYTFGSLPRETVNKVIRLPMYIHAQRWFMPPRSNSVRPTLT
jgi:hypothetical protein